MWIEIFPSVVMLTIVIWYFRGHRQQPILQIYSLITASYLNLFPLLNYLLSDGRDMNSFSFYQWIILFFFQLPLLFTAHLVVGRPLRITKNKHQPAILSPLLPWVLLLMLAGFWYVSLRYDLFFRRIGHEQLQVNSVQVPTILLYIYRVAVETSFFVLMFLWTVLHYVGESICLYNRYKWTLRIYLCSFLMFYFANSRMHLILLLLCALCTKPGLVETIQKRLSLVILAPLILSIALGLTLLRELVFEDNFRIETGDLGEMLRAVTWLIAARLDSLIILHELDHIGFEVWRFDLAGIAHSFWFALSFFLDSQTYSSIKESLITSPSVLIVNQLLGFAVVDFPKSMVLDVLLSFGLFGLFGVAIFLGSLIAQVQRQISRFRGFQMKFLLSLYSLPMLLEFEKEFIGFLFSFLKWLPVFLIIYWLRPRFKRQCSQQNITTTNHCSLR